MTAARARVLLAEDDRMLRTAAATMLHRGGFDVIAAEDGEQALALAEAARPEVILRDLVMPKVDGFEALRRLRASAATREIPIIVLSNLGWSNEVQSALAGGATGFLVKSALSLADLVAEVRKVLAASARSG